MTFLFCGALGELELDEVRQKGEPVLAVFVSTHSKRRACREPTTRDLCVGKQLVSYPGCHDACCSLEDHEPTWTISCRRFVSKPAPTSSLPCTSLTCGGCFFIVAVRVKGSRDPAVARRMRRGPRPDLEARPRALLPPRSGTAAPSRSSAHLCLEFFSPASASTTPSSRPHTLHVILCCPCASLTRPLIVSAWEIKRRDKASLHSAPRGPLPQAREESCSRFAPTPPATAPPTWPTKTSRTTSSTICPCPPPPATRFWRSRATRTLANTAQLRR
jgi:hypothetical protein